MNFDDWHRKGVWLVHTPDGKPYPETARSTAYECRADYSREHNCQWSRAEGEGYSIKEYEVKS